MAKKASRRSPSSRDERRQKIRQKQGGRCPHSGLPVNGKRMAECPVCGRTVSVSFDGTLKAHDR